MTTTAVEPMAIGRRIQLELDTRGMTAAQLAKKAGLGRSTITRVIRGERKPTPETLATVAPALGVTFAQLIAGTDAARLEEVVADVVSRAHYDEALKLVFDKESSINELTIQLLSLKELIQTEQHRRAECETRLREKEAECQEAKDAAARYQRALTRAVADVAKLQTALREVSEAVEKGKTTSRVAAILAGAAAVASVSIAAYLAGDSKDSRPTRKR